MKERTRKDIPIELPPAFQEEALHLRNKLLMYRFRNRNKIKTLSESGGDLGIDFSVLPDRMQQAARPLSVVVGDQPELQDMLKKFLEEKAKTLVLDASDTIEGHTIRILADEEPAPNGDTLIWELTISNIFERITEEIGDLKLRSGQVRSRANSLGLKTKKGYVGDKRQRVITCDKPLFDRLKRRYIPEEPDIYCPDPDSSYWGLDIIWDDLDDLDNDGGEAPNACDTDGSGVKPFLDYRVVVDECTHGDSPPCDRPDCPERPKTDLMIAADLQRAETQRLAKEAHDRDLVEKYTKTPPPTECLACKYPTGSGYGNYENGNFCSTCGPKLVMVRAALKAHPEFSLSELFEDLAKNGRPPRKEHLPAMIQYLKEAVSSGSRPTHETINQLIDEV